MRTIFIIGLVLVCAFMAGWFTVHREDGETTIKLNGDEIRNDTRNVITKGKDILRRNDGDQFSPQQQLQPGQSVPASWAQQPQQQQNPNQFQQQGQQYPQQQYAGQQQQYPNQQFQAQQPQQPQGGFYYPDNQQAKRPQAPWEGQLNAPTQGQQPGQF